MMDWTFMAWEGKAPVLTCQPGEIAFLDAYILTMGILLKLRDFLYDFKIYWSAIILFFFLLMLLEFFNKANA